MVGCSIASGSERERGKESQVTDADLGRRYMAAAEVVARQPVGQSLGRGMVAARRRWWQQVGVQICPPLEMSSLFVWLAGGSAATVLRLLQYLYILSNY